MIERERRERLYRRNLQLVMVPHPSPLTLCSAVEGAAPITAKNETILSHHETDEDV